MTTIIYKNGVLAADRRSSAKNTHEKCIRCGGAHFGNELDKIAQPARGADSLFQGEPIKFAACTGLTMWCNAMREAIRKGTDIEGANQFLNSLNRKSRDNPAPFNPSGAALIITDKGIYVYRPMRDRQAEDATSYPLDTKEIITLGSGGPYAYMAAQMGHGPVVAAAMAGQYDHAAGQNINWVRLGETQVHLSQFKLPTMYRDRHE